MTQAAVQTKEVWLHILDPKHFQTIDDIRGFVFSEDYGSAFNLICGVLDAQVEPTPKDYEADARVMARNLLRDLETISEAVFRGVPVSVVDARAFHPYETVEKLQALARVLHVHEDDVELGKAAATFLYGLIDEWRAKDEADIEREAGDARS